MVKKTDTRLIRINRFLSMCGLGSRRSCEKYVVQGKVKINGKAVTSLAQKVDPEKDRINVKGNILKPREKHVHLILNKPRGYVVSRKRYNKKNVFDLIRGFPKDLTYAGRLDIESEGLLFLSTHKDIVERLTHPKHKVSKIYIVGTDRELTGRQLVSFRKGIPLEDGMTRPAQIDSIKQKPPLYRIILTEGRKRQIREMMTYLGVSVETLVRVALGPLKLGNLHSGTFRHLTDNELGKLKRDLGIGKI
jgi:pseudouridine synthase